MEIETTHDQVGFTVTREQGQALLDMADLGLRLIEALELVARPASTAHAISLLKPQLAKGRTRTVAMALGKAEASQVAKAVDVGIRSQRAFGRPEPDGATEALVELRHAISVADTPDPAHLIVQRRDARRSRR